MYADEEDARWVAVELYNKHTPADIIPQPPTSTGQPLVPKKKRRPATHHGVRRYCPRIPGNSMPEFPGLTWGYVQRSNRPSPYLVSFYHNGKHNTGQCYVTEEAAADEAWPLYRKLYNLPWIKPPPLKLLPQYRKQLQAALDEPAPAQSAGTQHAAILSDALPAPEQQQQ